MAALLDTPLWAMADLTAPPGVCFFLSLSLILSAYVCVCVTLLDTPLWAIADLTVPPGVRFCVVLFCCCVFVCVHLKCQHMCSRSE